MATGNKSSILITFAGERCVVEADTTASELKHAFLALGATLLDEDPAILTPKEQAILKDAIRALLKSALADVH